MAENDYESLRAALCFGDLKQAALYFDRVLPIAFSFKIGKSDNGKMSIDLPEAQSSITDDMLYEIAVGIPGIGDRVKGGYLWRSLFGWDDHFRRYREQLADRPRPGESYTSYVCSMYLRNQRLANGDSIRKPFLDHAASLGIHNPAIFLPAHIASDLPPKVESVGTAMAVSFRNLQLVDTENASWEQIVELRKDTESASRLRRLRLFMFETYSNKPIQYVEDDIALRLEKYQATVNKFGFTTTLSTLSMLLDATNLRNIGVAALAGAILGGPVGAVTTSAVVELGHICIHLSRQSSELRDFKDQHDFAYVVQAKNRIES